MEERIKTKQSKPRRPKKRKLALIHKDEEVIERNLEEKYKESKCLQPSINGVIYQ